MNRTIVSLKRRQSGVVLIMTLVILLILTLLGISSIQMTGISNVMARNVVDSDVAIRAAEAGILVAEAVVENETALTAYQANANGKYEAHAVGATPRWEDDATWDGVNSVAVDYSDGYSQPLYMIEFVRTIVTDEDTLNLDNVGGGTGEDRIQVFRITSLGTGKTESTKVLLQSMYGKQF